MKTDVKPPEVIVDDWEMRARPALSTDEDQAAPDPAPGMGQKRDDFLDAQARGPDRTPEDHEPTASERQAEVDVMQSIQEANDRLAGLIRPVLPPAPVDPLLALKRLG